RMDLERAEPARERDLLLVADRLVREHENQVLEPGPVDRGDRRVIERPREVDAADLGADQRMASDDLEGGLHAFVSLGCTHRDGHAAAVERGSARRQPSSSGVSGVKSWSATNAARVGRRIALLTRL